MIAKANGAKDAKLEDLMPHHPNHNREATVEEAFAMIAKQSHGKKNGVKSRNSNS